MCWWAKPEVADRDSGPRPIRSSYRAPTQGFRHPSNFPATSLSTSLQAAARAMLLRISIGIQLIRGSSKCKRETRPWRRWGRRQTLRVFHEAASGKVLALKTSLLMTH